MVTNYYLGNINDLAVDLEIFCLSFNDNTQTIRRRQRIQSMVDCALNWDRQMNTAALRPTHEIAFAVTIGLQINHCLKERNL